MLRSLFPDLNCVLAHSRKHIGNNNMSNYGIFSRDKYGSARESWKAFSHGGDARGGFGLAKAGSICSSAGTRETQFRNRFCQRYGPLCLILS